MPSRAKSRLVGAETADSTWLGVPLKAEGRTTGVLVVQSYTKDVRYTERDKGLLAFVGQHVGAALSRARAIEETRQRNAELAIINSVQKQHLEKALAGQLEVQALYDIVGDRLRDIFDAQVVDIAVYDEAADVLRFPYTIERGVRFADEPMPVIGFRRHVMETREPLLINVDVVGEAERYGNPLLSGEPAKSWLGVPFIAAGKARGVITVQDVDHEHAFTESDKRLLATLAGSLSVALENARLMDETQRRVAELATVNSVRAGPRRAPRARRPDRASWASGCARRSTPTSSTSRCTTSPSAGSTSPTTTRAASGRPSPHSRTARGSPRASCSRGSRL